LLFAIGLFDAGFLGALCISLATSWALGEVFGWAHSLNRSVREAPWFYVAYTLMLLAAGAVCLFSGEETQNKITIFVQVVAVTLLPPALIFLVLLLNDKPLMGEHVNTRWQNVANWSIIIFVILMSGLYGVYSLFFET
jgi:Mn2+/Fe2+ NRAMP family transporter